MRKPDLRREIRDGGRSGFVKHTPLWNYRGILVGIGTFFFGSCFLASYFLFDWKKTQLVQLIAKFETKEDDRAEILARRRVRHIELLKKKKERELGFTDPFLSRNKVEEEGVDTGRRQR